MSRANSTKCFIEEYENERGQRCARLREKVTARKVNLGLTTVEGKQDFLRFLGAAAMNKTAIPDVFSKDGDGRCIVVSGDIDFDAPDEIRYVYNPRLSYVFA
jgi:hypothetical protein